MATAHVLYAPTSALVAKDEASLADYLAFCHLFIRHRLFNSQVLYTAMTNRFEISSLAEIRLTS